MSGWNDDTAWRSVQEEAACLADGYAASLEAVGASKVIGGRVIDGSRLRAAAQRLRAASEGDVPADFDPGILTAWRRPYAASDLARELMRRALGELP